MVIVLRSKAQYSACVEQKQPPPDSFQQTHPAISQNSLQMKTHIPKIKDKKKSCCDNFQDLNSCMKISHMLVGIRSPSHSLMGTVHRPFP